MFLVISRHYTFVYWWFQIFKDTRGTTEKSNKESLWQSRQQRFILGCQETSYEWQRLQWQVLFISYKFVKGFLAITFLLLLISSWNLHDTCQRFLCSQKRNFSSIRQKTKNFPLDPHWKIRVWQTNLKFTAGSGSRYCYIFYVPKLHFYPAYCWKNYVISSILILCFQKSYKKLWSGVFW